MDRFVVANHIRGSHGDGAFIENEVGLPAPLADLHGNSFYNI